MEDKIEDEKKRNEDFLRDFFKDCQEEMRYRTEIEFRFVGFLLASYSFIGAIMGFLANKAICQTSYFQISIVISIFLSVISGIIIKKICEQNKIYKYLGKRVEKIWTYFKFYEEGAYLEGTILLKNKGHDCTHKKCNRYLEKIMVPKIKTYLLKSKKHNCKHKNYNRYLEKIIVPKIQACLLKSKKHNKGYEYGEGHGYILTIWLILAITVGIIAIIWTIGIVILPVSIK